ncbi:MAG: hypothetical protein ISS52_01635 [Dehalococcoidia bacterium]|nr:hypothetical protein [Dehalococcoidia bacterium]
MLHQETKPARRTATLQINPTLDPKVIAFQEEVRSICAFMEQATVSTKDDVSRITQDLALISTLTKTIDAKRREFTDPLRNHERSINDLFATLTGPLANAYKAGKRKIIDYNQHQERIRQQAELTARAAAAASAALVPAVPQVDSATGEISNAPPPLPAPVLPDQPQITVRTELGTASQRMIPKYRVISFKDLPDEYKVENTGLLNSAVKGGIRAIRGVEIWLEPDIRITRR